MLFVLVKNSSNLLRCISCCRIDMPFGICAKPSKDDLMKEISAVVEVPGKTFVEVTVGRDALGLDCLEKIANEIGLTEVGFFGLSYKNKRGHDWWLILEKPIRKQLEKHAASGLCNIKLKFKIRFFMADPSCMRLQDEAVRNLLYLQLKNQIIEGSLSCSKDTAVLLASYSAQADLGDYHAERYSNYIEDQNHFPFNGFTDFSKDDLEQEVMELYQHHRGMASEEAKLQYVTITQKLVGYGDEYYPAKDKGGLLILIGASFLGIVVRHPRGLPPAYFRWPDIVQMSHCKKYFCIESFKSFDTIHFEMDDPATAKYVWRMFVAHHRFRCLSNAKAKKSLQSSAVKPDKERLLRRDAEVATSSDGTSSDCSSTICQGSVSGILNPVFDDERQSFREEKNVIDSVSHSSSAGFKAAPSTLLRPQSLNLVSVTSQHDFVMHNNLCASENSLNQNQSLYSNGLLNHAVSNGVGSSISMDSGNPQGAQSLESLNDRICSGIHSIPPRQASPASNDLARPCRPRSLNLDQFVTDNSSEVTGRTSGYSTSNDSDLAESRELDFEDEDLPMSREEQLAELEKILHEGQVFSEFQKLERRSENLTTASAAFGENVEKNRYKDVVPYEDTRVRLNPQDNLSGSDYVNADFVKMEVGSRTYHYIATQGPMEKTVVDFWHMVWEQNVHIIVAATDNKIDSRSACYPYWSADSPCSKTWFSSFEIETVSVRDEGSYKVRTLSLRQVVTKKSRVICHLHFTDWPDNRVPEDPKSFLEFLEELESARQSIHMSKIAEPTVGPVMVHCTAGVGRTGVIILTDLMIACLQSNQRINVAKALTHLRCQRMLLVANFGQYRFVYTALIHFIKNSRLI